MHFRFAPRTLVGAPGLDPGDRGLALSSSAAVAENDALSHPDRPKGSNTCISGRYETPAAAIDPLELGILCFQAAAANGGAESAADATDNRLPIALLNRRRRKRQKHRFDDAPGEEVSLPKKKKRKKKKTKKNKVTIIFLDSDNEDEMEVGKEDKKGKSAANEDHDMLSTKQVNHDIDTDDGCNGEEGTEIQTHPSKSNKTLKIKTTSIGGEMVTGESSSSAAAGTTAETTLRVVTPVQAETTTTNPPQQYVQEISPSVVDEMEILRESFSKNYIGKPRKNRICPDSIFADAVQEVLQEDDDDSVGSGIGAGNSATTSPTATATATAGDDREGSVPLWEQQQQQQHQQQQKAASMKTNESSPLVPNPRKDSLRSFQHIPPGGYESFDMFHPEKMKERLRKQQKEKRQQQQQSQPPRPRAPLDVPPPTAQRPKRGIAKSQEQKLPVMIVLADDSSSDDGNEVNNDGKADSRQNKTLKKVRQLQFKRAAETKKASDRRASIEETDDAETVDLDLEDLTKEDETASKRGRKKLSPEPADHHTEDRVEAVVTDSSDSEGSNFVFTEDSKVGKCERKYKDDDMKAELKKFRARSRSAKRRPYSLLKFLELWKDAEDDLGFSAKEVEKSSHFRRANRKVEKHDSDEQGQAQYGRILPAAMEKVFHEVMGLKPDSIFVDLGHGIGNTCLQAAYTIGCDCKGIELVDARFFASEAFHRCLAKAANEKRDEKPSKWNLRAGSIELKHGRLENPAYLDWLTSDVHHVFVNNFAEVFGHRSAPKNPTTNKPAITVDSRIAAMFASMKPGSVMVTLHPIDALGLTRDEVLTYRNKEHKKGESLKTSNAAHASFFNMETIELGPANETVSWSADGGRAESILVHKYTRLHQATMDEGAVFLCTNVSCEQAIKEKPIPATINGKSGLLMNRCSCNYTPIRTRNRGGGSKKVSAKGS